VPRRLIPVGFVLSSLIALFLGAPAGASAEACPQSVYRGSNGGDYPNVQLGWTDNVQGVAHDAGHWFFSTQDDAHLLKIPVGLDLFTPLDPDDPDSWPSGVSVSEMPEALEDLGFDDFKDLEQVKSFLFVPVAGDDPDSGEDIAGIAVVRAADLSYVGVLELEGWTHASAAFFNSHEGLLYVSRSSVSEDVPLERYAVDFGKLSAGNAAGAFTPAGTLALWDDAGPISPGIKNIQGATFTPWGDLYVVNGLESPTSLDRGGIHLFDSTGQLIDESSNGSGTFNFAYDSAELPEPEEPEGADWWNRDAGPAAPGIGGQLQVIMLDNDVFEDDLYFKHYDVNYSCIAAGDEDEDGLTNGAEIYDTGTDPRDADTDDDQLPDGLELEGLETDPLVADSDGDGTADGDEDADGDGVANGAEVNTHGTDPLDADTDTDGLTDGEEIDEHGSDPLDADSDDDGLTDGAEVEDHGTSPTDADTDDDSLDDGLEVDHGTDPLDSDSDGDGLLDGKDVEFVEHAIEALPASAFRSTGPGSRVAVLALLQGAESKLLAGKPEQAIDRLQTLRTHLDGCGGTPDRDDWVVDCPSQVEVRELVDLLIANVTA
jgi:hypothetical protein